LHLEALEVRECPSDLTLVAPVQPPDGILSDSALVVSTNSAISLRLSVVPAPMGMVTVSGQVAGATATGGRTVTLSGAVSGSVTTCADGTFRYTGPASGPGQIQAAVTDNAGNTAFSSVNLIAGPPTIVNFRAINNGNNSWTFTGQVQSPSATGLVVTLAGIPSLDSNNASATVQANGSFSFTVTLRPGENGTVTAECLDWWGQASNEATAYVGG
jgi:hypothetical protein